MDAYNFRTFLERMRGKNAAEVVAAARQEAESAYRRSFGVKGAVKAREAGSVQYARRLEKLVWFLHNGMRPAGISDADFEIFQLFKQQNSIT